MRQGGVGAVDRPQQVDRDRLPVQIEGRVEERPEHAGAGVVDPDVDPAERAYRPVRERRHRLGIGHVGGDRQRLSAAVADLAHQLVQHVAPAGGQDDAASAGGEGLRRGAADAARRAGDDDDLAAKVGHVGTSP